MILFCLPFYSKDVFVCVISDLSVSTLFFVRLASVIHKWTLIGLDLIRLPEAMSRSPLASVHSVESRHVHAGT
jgi:hypothetical protein